MLDRLNRVKERIRSDEMARHGLLMAGFGFAAGFFNYLYQLGMGRMLQPEDYGILMSLVNIFLIISIFALTFRTVMTRYVSRYQAEGRLDMSGYLWRLYQKRTLILGVVSFVVLGLLSPPIAGFLNIDQYWLPVIVFSTLIFAFALPVNYGTLNGLQRFVPLGACNTLQAMLKVGFGVLLIKLGCGLAGGLLAFLLAFGIVFFITLYLLRDLPKSGSQRMEISGLGAYAGLAFVAILAFSMLTNVDVVLVKHFLDADTAGNYAAIAVLGRAALFVPMGIALAMFPKTSGCLETGVSHRPLLLVSMLLTLVSVGALVVLYWLFPDFFVNLLGTDKYTLAAPHLFRYGLAFLFFSLSYIMVNYFLSLDRTRVAYPFMAVALLQVVLILYFHADIGQVVNVMLVTGALNLISMAFFYLWTQRPFHRRAA